MDCDSRHMSLLSVCSACVLHMVELWTISVVCVGYSEEQMLNVKTIQREEES